MVLGIFQGNPPLKSYLSLHLKYIPVNAKYCGCPILSNIRWNSSHDITIVIFSDQRDQWIIMYIANNTLPVSYTLSEFIHSKYITYIMHYPHSVRAIDCAHDIKYISAPIDGLFILYTLPQSLPTRCTDRA